MSNTCPIPVTLSFEGKVLSDLNAALRKEWLETNGLGGYSSSTIWGLNTRRYHGLLVAATRPPRGRMVMLSKLEEILVIRGEEYPLSCNEYPGVIHPQGYRFLVRFGLEPFPTFVYQVGEARLEKTVFMPREKNAVAVRYRLQGELKGAVLLLKPMIACRDHHHLRRESPAINPDGERKGEEIKFSPYSGVPSLFIGMGGGEFFRGPDWYRDFRYRQEMARGLDYEEDLFCPGMIGKKMESGETWDVVAGIESTSDIDVDREWEKELARRKQLVASVSEAPGYIRQLHLAADSFLVKGREGKPAIIAGYHWFSDWGRDTMIALPGLTLVNGRLGEAREILASTIAQMDQGLIPNFFPEGGESPAYNTIDATLWLFVAGFEYFRRSGDEKFLRERLYPALRDSIGWHVNGTHNGIVVDGDGLLMGGDDTTQLTWMDAKPGDRPVTSRHGKAVEVNALWYNACRIMQELAQILHESGDARWFGNLARRARTSFQKSFWNPDKGCLFDCMGDGWADGAVRPNQLLALSLPFPLIAGPKARSLVEVVEAELLVPLGLRSLSPKDSCYAGRCQGDQRQRDAAYHQGTAWPWLIGPFLKAYLRTQGGKKARARAEEILAAFEEHLCDAGIGTISEILDGDYPHQPRGCISQAWSVGAVLASYWEEVAGGRMDGGR